MNTRKFFKISLAIVILIVFTILIWMIMEQRKAQRKMAEAIDRLRQQTDQNTMAARYALAQAEEQSFLQPIAQERTRIGFMKDIL